MRLLKKTLRITFIALVLLITLAFAAPYLFKGKIISLVKNEINKNLNAKADFKDVSISFFRHFPKVSLAIEGLQITGLDSFESDTLIAAKDIDISLNLPSFIKGSDYTIYAININEPRIHAVVTKDGKANWNITKPDTLSGTAAAKSKPYRLNLKYYAIRNGEIVYDDASSNMHSRITNLNHEGSGDFTSDLFTLKTTTTADAVSFSYSSIPYLYNTRTSILADIQVDNKNNTYTIRQGDVRLNELKITADGLFTLLNDSTYDMDIRFNSPSTAFKEILSLVPAVYKTDFDKIKTSGSATFGGWVKGKYGNTQMPAYKLNMAVANGYFQYPDLPKPIKNINFNLDVDNPDGITDHSLINLSQAHIEFDQDPFDLALLVKNPVSDPFIDAKAKGKLDLSKIAQLIKLEAGTRLSGLLNADLALLGNVSAIEKQQADKFKAEGKIDLEKFLYASKDYPDGVQLNKLLMTFNPRNVFINEVSGQYLKTNFSGNGIINNLLPYALKNQPLDGTLTVKADQLNLNNWMGVSTDTATASVQSDPFAVPAHIRFGVNASIDKVHYDKLDLEKVTGNIQIADETVKMNNVSANALDGTMLVNGSYSTRNNKKHPEISLNYEVKDLDVQKTFYAFNTVQKLMPVGQYVSGKLSSRLNLTGKLGENMMPDLNSLTGEGNLFLIQGLLKKFAPVEKLAQSLNVKELESISLKDVKNYIQFANGKVLVKPFRLKVNQIDMEIGGMHGFDQSLDYVINLKLPRSMLGEKGNELVNGLALQVSNKGVPVKMNETVDLNVKMGGFIKNPILKTDLKQSANQLANDFKQQVTDFAKQKLDSTRSAVTSAVKDTIASAKKQIVLAAEDELKKQLLGKKDSSATADQNANDSRKRLEETGKGLIENLNPFRKKKKQTDSVKREG